MSARGWFLGVDVGGTFTDVVLASSDGELHVGKVLTTPEDPRVGVVAGLHEVLTAAGLDGAQLTRVVHGTTLATNVVLQRRGGPVALVTTEGFADLLRLGREARVEDDRYDLFFSPTPPPVDPELTFEVRERVDARGGVLVALDDDALHETVARVAAAAPAGVAVCLLHSYARPEHERAVVDACRQALPDAYVVCSSDIWPEMREYERAMTTVVCAFVGPVMSRYLSSLTEHLRESGVTCPLEVMESSGGVVSAEVAARRPVVTLESGGAAGVLAAGIVGETVGAAKVISFDMGGTTAKTGIVVDGRPVVRHDFQIGGKGSFGGARAGTGIPVRVPVVDLAEVGAGGGSIAWLDPSGELRVGPRSAGAVPGPACYGRGGEEPTVTDANLLLGYLDPSRMAGGVHLEPDLARAAIARRVADPLGVSPSDAARAIHEIVNASMAAAIRVVTIQRGIDPREFIVVSFGGAGPMHVASLAATFGIRTAVVPWAAGVAAAVGLVSTDLSLELVQTHRVDLGHADADEIEQTFTSLTEHARSELGGKRGSTSVARAADLHFRGQAHEVTVPVADRLLDRGALLALAQHFREHYRHSFGIDSEAPVELTNLRVRVTRAVEKLRPHPLLLAEPKRATPIGERAAWFAGHDRPLATAVYDWGELVPGSALAGPAVVHGPDSTIVVPPTHRAHLDEWRNVVLSFGGYRLVR
jgi:N-methylhydantoinase A